MLVQMLVVTVYHRAAGETQIALLVVLIVKSLLGWIIINFYISYSGSYPIQKNILFLRIQVRNILIILWVWLHIICDAYAQRQIHAGIKGYSFDKVRYINFTSTSRMFA